MVHGRCTRSPSLYPVPKILGSGEEGEGSLDKVCLIWLKGNRVRSRYSPFQETSIEESTLEDLRTCSVE